MNCNHSTTRIAAGAVSRGRAGFTLAEVLAAMVFMAIVIPVAVRGLRVASLAGEVGQRKAAAARVAERVLNEMIVTGTYLGGSQRGVINEGALQYQWNMTAQPWTEDALQQINVQVFFTAQGKSYDVILSTLVNNNS
jgi:type II secretory pathway pseudopilin PulG